MQNYFIRCYGDTRYITNYVANQYLVDLFAIPGALDTRNVIRHTEVPERLGTREQK